MAETHDRLDDDLQDWITAQHVFFVATAPGGADGRVNVSPKGYDTFRILDERTVAYLDLTGSGVETIAHLRDNGRITFMFCGFTGPPRILRLFGHGEVIRHADERFDDLRAEFPPMHGVRSVIRCDLERIQTSCGFAVPFMTFEAERQTLKQWSARAGSDALDEYQAEKNRRSIDGLPALLGE